MSRRSSSLPVVRGIWVFAEAALEADLRVPATAHSPLQLNDLVSRYGDRVRAVALDEAEIRALIERWSKAVRDEDLPAIRADHDPEF